MMAALPPKADIPLLGTKPHDWLFTNQEEINHAYIQK